MVCVVRDKPLQKIWGRGWMGGGGISQLAQTIFPVNCLCRIYFGRGGGGERFQEHCTMILGVRNLNIDTLHNLNN